jgi:galactose mutarotase-like enzyme
MGIRHASREIGGFAVHSLTNGRIAVAVVPELGGRIVSLRGGGRRREWLDGWLPAARRRLWRPTDPADFASGPGAGIDECLPSVLACRVGDRAIPDHGDIWNAPAGVDGELAARGVLACSWRCGSLPLAFERRLELRGPELRLDYRLENLAAEPVPFLWAWHPLFAWKRGDEIRFAPSVNTCLIGDGSRLPWPASGAGTDLSRGRFAAGAVPAAKVFVGPLTEGAAEIRARSGARLTLRWPAELFPYAGIWITRGFWKGLHHWAIEPTNAPVDRLSEAAGHGAPGLVMLAPRELRTWRVTVGIHWP